MSNNTFDSFQKKQLEQFHDAVVNYVPRYNKPEDFLTGETDYHKMSQELAFLFPWPIAYEVDKLFRPEFSRYDANRLDQITPKTWKKWVSARRGWSFRWPTFLSGLFLHPNFHLEDESVSFCIQP